MQVLVTGGAGFIGSNFVHYLQRNHSEVKVRVFDKLTYAGMKESLSPLLEDGKIEFVEGDICDARQIAAALEGCDLVFNFAAESHVDNSIGDPQSFLQTNIWGVYTLLQSLRELKQKPLLVQISTDEVYGSLREGDPAFTTRHPTEPSSPYSASKAAGDHLVMSYLRTYKIPALITRSSNNYGPRQMPEKFIPRMLFRALNGKNLPIYGDGLQRRDWIFVDDNCQGLWTAATKGNEGEIYHFGGGQDCTNISLAKEILSRVEQSEDLLEHVTDRPGHDFRYCLDIADTTKKLGWRPSTKLTEGLGETIQWYQNNEAWLKAAHQKIPEENR